MKEKLKRLLALLLVVVLTVCALPAMGETLKTGMSGKKIKTMQQALYALGYYEGKVDSNYSKAFAQAVKDFQADFGLEETGQIDDELYDLLEEEAQWYVEPEVTAVPKVKPTKAPKTKNAVEVKKNEWYYDRDHVAMYIYTYKCLPGNFVTKSEARSEGWVSYQGNLWKVLPDMCIGGDYFGNYDELLPDKKGRRYTECDIDFNGGARNSKRIVFSNDGLIYYTEDHYETFEELIVYEGNRIEWRTLAK